MKKFIFLFLLLVIIGFYFLFFNKKIESNEYNINCSVVTMSCPDGFLTSCNSAYDPSTKICINCIPDCTGHETPIEIPTNASALVLCPDISPSPNFCKDGVIKPIYNDIGCIEYYECVK